MPALLFIDSTILIEHGSNQFFCSDEAPELNYSWVNPLNDLPLICHFIGTRFQGRGGKMHFGFSLAISEVVLLGFLWWVLH